MCTCILFICQMCRRLGFIMPVIIHWFYLLVCVISWYCLKNTWFPPFSHYCTNSSYLSIFIVNHVCSGLDKIGNYYKLHPWFGVTSQTCYVAGFTGMVSFIIVRSAKHTTILRLLCSTVIWILFVTFTLLCIYSVSCQIHQNNSSSTVQPCFV
jgi:hypothetical protein